MSDLPPPPVKYGSPSYTLDGSEHAWPFGVPKPRTWESGNMPARCKCGAWTEQRVRENDTRELTCSATGRVLADEVAVKQGGGNRLHPQ